MDKGIQICGDRWMKTRLLVVSMLKCTPIELECCIPET